MIESEIKVLLYFESAAPSTNYYNEFNALGRYQNGPDLAKQLEYD